MDKTEALIVLNEAQGLGPRSILELIRRFGSAEAVLKDDALAILKEEGAQTHGWAQSIADSLQITDSQAILKKAQHTGVQILTILDDHYPRLLSEIYDPPIVLYVKGNLSDDDALAMSVVGSRAPSIYGREQAFRFALDLAQAGFTIISGLARGIDAQAHRGALQAHGRTIAVLGCGIDVVYPKENQKLFEEVAEKGAIVTEFGFGVSPHPGHFPRRNRIISGLSLGVVVVEAHLQSGSLITARLALDEGREVYAVPGPVNSMLSQGSHALIKQGAKLVEKAEDVLVDFETVLRKMVLPDAKKELVQALPVVTEQENRILRLLEERACGADELMDLTQFQFQEVSSALLSLEMKRVVKKQYGGKFVLNSL